MYQENASAAVQKVINAAFAHRYATSSALSTRDGIVYSYALPIGNLRSEYGPWYVLDKKHSPSVTTSKHIGYLMRELPSKQIVVVDDVTKTPSGEEHTANAGKGVKVDKQNAAQKFFYKHAVFSYPSGATKAQQDKAHWETAAVLADAERVATERGWYVEWEDDPYPDTSWMDEEMLDEYQAGSTELLSALLKDENGDVLGSLGGVHVKKHRGIRDPYIRVVEAELALEALG